MPLLKKLLNKHTTALATNAAMPLIGMLVLSLMAHNLPKVDFGNYIFFLMIFILGDLFRTGFLQTSLVRFYSGAHPERALNMAGSAWGVGFILTATIVLLDMVLYFFYKCSNADMEATLKWFGIIYLTTLPLALASWILQAEERFDRLLILQILNQGGFLIFILLFIFFGTISFQTAIYSYFATNVISSLFCIISGWSKPHAIKHRSVQSMKDLANFGKYSVGTSISAYLLRGSDTFIIKLMFRAEMVAVYYIPQRLMEIFEIPMRSFVSTALPELSAANQRGDTPGVTIIMKRYAGMLTVALIPVAIGAFILAGITIRLLFGVKYEESEAVNIFRLFVCYVMLMPVDRFFGITLDIIGRPKLNMIKVFLMLSINVIGDFVGIWLFHSLYAVAVASLFTFLSGVVFGFWALKKHLNFTMRDIFSLGYSQLKDVVINLLQKNKVENVDI
jgi:O-antigen/teichoic acid export membrane protein